MLDAAVEVVSVAYILYGNNVSAACFWLRRNGAAGLHHLIYGAAGWYSLSACIFIFLQLLLFSNIEI